MIYLHNGLRELLKVGGNYPALVDQKMKFYKMTKDPREFCKEVHAVELAPLLEEAYNYDYEMKPDYEKLKRILDDAIHRLENHSIGYEEPHSIGYEDSNQIIREPLSIDISLPEPVINME